MKIYFDLCCLKRPFDGQSDPRIALETSAVLALLTACRVGMHELVTSDVLRFENERDPEPARRVFVSKVFDLAAAEGDRSIEVDRRAAEWNNVGVPAFDAYHLALAETHADVFCSCDDVLLKRIDRLPTSLRVVDLLTLFRELLPWESP